LRWRFLAGLSGAAWADPALKVSLEGGGQKVSGHHLQIILLLTVLSLVPAISAHGDILAASSSSCRFLRQAHEHSADAGRNQVLLGLALFLTLFIMAPTIEAVRTEAVQPYLDGQSTSQEALQKGSVPVREFMLRQTREKDLALFVQLSKARGRSRRPTCR